MRLFLLVAVPVVILGVILLWVLAHRVTPFYVRTTGLDIQVMEFTDDQNITMATMLNGSRDPRLIRNLAKGDYALAFALPERKDKEQDFNVGLGYTGTYRRRLDLDISPATTKDSWHIRLTADGTITLFERDVAFDDASGEHPCIIRF